MAGARAPGQLSLAFLTLAALVVADGAPMFAVHVTLVLLVGACCVRPDHGLAAITDARPLRWVGTVSYGVYLLHVSAITAWKRVLPAAWISAPLVFALSLLVSLGLAAASYRWFERPFLRLGDRFRGRGPFAPRRSSAKSSPRPREVAMRRAAVSSLAALATLAAACGSSPPPEAPEIPAPPAPVSAPALALASAAPIAAAPQKAAEPVYSGKVLEVVGGVTAASYPPTGFDKLTKTQRVIAYHLTQAVLAGDPIFTMQTSRYGWPATEVVRKLLAKKDKIDPKVAEKLALYRKMLFLHHGIHDAKTGQKLVPPLDQKEMEAAARAASVSIPGSAQGDVRSQRGAQRHQQDPWQRQGSSGGVRGQPLRGRDQR